MSGDDTAYVHGYSETERERLLSQSRFLEPWIYERIDLGGARRVLEIGCGVGAQLKIMARRFPKAHLTGIDHAPSQLAKAKEVVAAEVDAGRVTLVQGHGDRLPFDDGAFGAVFLCWVLEHVVDQVAVLREARRVLAPGGTIYATEVYNASLRLEPPHTALAAWWQKLSDLQRELGGDPYVGPRLGTLFTDAAFKNVSMLPVPFVLDGRVRDPAERGRHVTYWRELFQSATPGLEAAGKVAPGEWERVVADFAALQADPRGIFYITAVQARGER